MIIIPIQGFVSLKGTISRVLFRIPLWGTCVQSKFIFDSEKICTDWVMSLPESQNDHFIGGKPIGQFRGTRRQRCQQHDMARCPTVCRTNRSVGVWELYTFITLYCLVMHSFLWSFDQTCFDFGFEQCLDVWFQMVKISITLLCFDRFTILFSTTSWPIGP